MSDGDVPEPTQGEAKIIQLNGDRHPDQEGARPGATRRDRTRARGTTAHGTTQPAQRRSTTPTAATKPTAPAAARATPDADDGGESPLRGVGPDAAGPRDANRTPAASRTAAETPSRGRTGATGEVARAPRARRRTLDGPASADPPATVTEMGPRPAVGDADRTADDADRPADDAERPGAGTGDLESALAGVLAFLRRRITGDYVIDEHGFDADLTEHVLAPLLRPIYRDYFRVETRGLENIPDTGGALVVANHSGTLPVDALMMAMAILDHHPAHRNLRMLAADLVFAVPFLAPFARKIGNTLACQADAERLLGAGHLVGVWPEGFKGVGKPFRDRYTLQRFGRGGFVSAALRAGVPIIPCTVVGAEEIYPMIGNAKSLARLLGLPYLPITPTFPWLGLFGLVPLPSKWYIEFGEPVATDVHPPEAADDPMLVFELTDSIRETIQHTLYSLLMQRRSVFF